MDPFNRLRRLHLYRCQQTQKQSAAICVEIPRLRIFHTVELEVGMKSLHDPVWDFTYRVEYLRTQDWYDSGGRWRELSDWCTETFGWRNWDYYNQQFCFREASDRTAFILRWL